MTAPLDGRTVFAHVEGLLRDTTETLTRVSAAIRAPGRLRPAQRQHLGRELAGVVGRVETIRLWLGGGAIR